MVERYVKSYLQPGQISPLQISDTPQAEFEPAQYMGSDFVEWSCPVVITSTWRRQPTMPTLPWIISLDYLHISKRPIIWGAY